MPAPGNGAAASQVKPEQKRDQLRRVYQSAALRNATHLREFLAFVGDLAIKGDSDGATEYDIATRVFGRPEGFDPAGDTIVRTQAYRLRQKLKEYYEGEGARDAILLELPKGSYIPTFTVRNVAQDTPAVQPAHRPSKMRTTAALGLVTILALATGYWIGARASGTSQIESTLVQSFWRNFLGEGDALVGYTNQVFLVDEDGNKFLVPSGPLDERGAEASIELSNRVPQHKGRLFFDDAYTGTGEVLTAHLLTLVLARVPVPFSFRRSMLLNVEDLKQHNVIFVGSPQVNPTLADLRLPRHFVFSADQGGAPPWPAKFVNTNPRAGEPSSFGVERREGSGILTHDYAVVEVHPGLRPGRKVMVLAGLTTSGTQGAVEFVTSAKHLEALWNRVGGNRWPESMALLLRIETAKGLDVQSVELLYSRFEGGTEVSTHPK